MRYFNTLVIALKILPGTDEGIHSREKDFLPAVSPYLGMYTAIDSDQ
jgi:hypothetical protein